MEEKQENQPTEILRVLLEDDLSMQVFIRPGPASKAPLWGIVLADVIRHLSRVHHQEHGRPEKKTRTAILEVLKRELAEPDPDLEGGILRGGPGG